LARIASRASARVMAVRSDMLEGIYSITFGTTKK
jgi:hypothetical protein